MKTKNTHDSEAQQTAPQCLICGEPLTVRLTSGRKSGKPFIMLICSKDGRHFRAFINHRPYVQQVVESIEGRTA